MRHPKRRIILFNKPFDVLCQFTDQRGRMTLADFVDIPDVYPAGRLDRDSEGLVVLTNDGRLQARISDPKYKHEKTYLVQVEGEIDSKALLQLETGVPLKDGFAKAIAATHALEPDWLWPRRPPIRVRKTLPTSWLKLTLSEGRNRQVRRMTAHVGYPTLRLVRLSIGHWSLNGLQSGEFRKVCT